MSVGAGVRGRSAIAAAVAVFAALMCAGPAAADEIPDDATWKETYLRSKDGTRLHVDVFRPKELTEEDRTPVIVIVSPYLGALATTDDNLDQLGTDNFEKPSILRYYRDLFDVAFKRGYSIVQVTLRGEGDSEGCPDVGGRGEQGDAEAAVEWAASRRWSTGRVGMWGLSWDGYEAVMNLANRPRGLRAAVIQAPVIDLHRGLWSRGVRYARAYPGSVYYHLLSQVPGSPLPLSARWGFDTGEPSDPGCAKSMAELAEKKANPDPDTKFWRERNMIPGAAGSELPVLWVHGFLDEQVYGTSFLPVWSRLRGPHRAWFGQFPHVVAGEAELGRPETLGRSGFTKEAMRWLDRYVKGESKHDAPVHKDPPVEVQEGAEGGWRTERRWPPDDVRRRSLPLLAFGYPDAPGNKAYPGCYRIELSCPPGPSGIGNWTFTQALPYDVHFAGVPKLELELRTAVAGVHAIGLIYDVDEEGNAAFVSRGAAAVPEALPNTGKVRLPLYPQDWRFREGHRIGVLVTGADDLWFSPPTTGTPVQVLAGKLTLPFLRFERDSDLEGGPSEAISQRVTFPVPQAFIELRTQPAQLPGPLEER